MFLGPAQGSAAREHRAEIDTRDLARGPGATGPEKCDELAPIESADVAPRPAVLQPHSRSRICRTLASVRARHGFGVSAFSGVTVVENAGRSVAWTAQDGPRIRLRGSP
jgi:hypothetical protein